MSTSNRLPAVATPTVAGVTLGRHVLDKEAASLARITRQVGKRLRRWMRETPEFVQGMNRVWEDGKLYAEPMLHEDGTPVMVPVLPGEDFRENYRYYSTTVLGLLKEQRERARLTPATGAPPVSDEEFDASLRDLVATAIRAMPQSELDKLLRERDLKPAITIEEADDE